MDVENLYNQWAKSYDNQKNPAIISEGNNLLDLLDVKQGETILDLGCGTGRYIEKIQKKANVIGIDISDEMLNVCRKKINKNVKLIKANFEECVDFGNVDKVIASLSITHIKDLEKLFLNVKKISKKFVFSTFCKELKQPFITTYEDPINKEFVKGNFINYQHKIEDIIYIINKTGWIIEKIIITKIDESLKEAITEESYETNKNKPFLAIFSIVN